MRKIYKLKPPALKLCRNRTRHTDYNEVALASGQFQQACQLVAGARAGKTPSDTGIVLVGNLRSVVLVIKHGINSKLDPGVETDDRKRQAQT